MPIQLLRNLEKVFTIQFEAHEWKGLVKTRSEETVEVGNDTVCCLCAYNAHVYLLFPREMGKNQEGPMVPCK